ncbi:MAG: hypothetical protein QW478_00735 [Candidatus Micrarchaeaceae archaeon]
MELILWNIPCLKNIDAITLLNNSQKYITTENNAFSQDEKVFINKLITNLIKFITNFKPNECYSSINSYTALVKCAVDKTFKTVEIYALSGMPSLNNLGGITGFDDDFSALSIQEQTTLATFYSFVAILNLLTQKYISFSEYFNKSDLIMYVSQVASGTQSDKISLVNGIINKIYIANNSAIVPKNSLIISPFPYISIPFSQESGKLNLSNLCNSYTIVDCSVISTSTNYTIIQPTSDLLLNCPSTPTQLTTVNSYVESLKSQNKPVFISTPACNNKGGIDDDSSDEEIYATFKGKHFEDVKPCNCGGAQQVAQQPLYQQQYYSYPLQPYLVPQYQMPVVQPQVAQPQVSQAQVSQPQVSQHQTQSNVPQSQVVTQPIHVQVPEPVKYTVEIPQSFCSSSKKKITNPICQQPVKSTTRLLS